MDFITTVNGYPVLCPGLLAHSFSLNRGPLTIERLDRIIEGGITGGYDNIPTLGKKALFSGEDALFMSIHGFGGRYNASIGKEYGITSGSRTSGVAIVFKEDLNRQIRHRKLIPDKVIDDYLSKLFNRMVAEERIKPKEKEDNFREALRYGGLERYLDSEGKNSLFTKLGIKMGMKDTNRPHTYSSTILDLYATQKMRKGDYSMNIMTNSEDGVRAFDIKDGIAVPLRVMPSSFEGLMVGRYFTIEGVEMCLDPEWDCKIGNLEALKRIVGGRIPLYVYCESESDIPKDASEVQTITPLGYIPIAFPDNKTVAPSIAHIYNLEQRHHIARVN